MSKAWRTTDFLRRRLAAALPVAFPFLLAGMFGSSRQGRRPVRLNSKRVELPLEIQGRTWMTYVQVPDSAEDGNPLPLVLVLHGTSKSATDYLNNAGWGDIADKRNVIVAAPNGFPMKPEASPKGVLNARVWNTTQLEKGSPRAAIDDMAFFQELIPAIRKRWRVDSRAIYVVGHSNGGTMAFRLAVEMPRTFAAMAAVCTHPGWTPGWSPPTPIPTMLLVGDADPLVPLLGGMSSTPWNPARRVPPLRRALATWIDGNGASPTPVKAEGGRGYSREVYPPTIRGGAPLELVVVRLQGHSWPGATGFAVEKMLGPNLTNVDATEIVWSFLREHRRGRA